MNSGDKISRPSSCESRKMPLIGRGSPVAADAHSVDGVRVKHPSPRATLLRRRSVPNGTRSWSRVAREQTCMVQRQNRRDHRRLQLQARWWCSRPDHSPHVRNGQRRPTREVTDVGGRSALLVYGELDGVAVQVDAVVIKKNAASTMPPSRVSTFDNDVSSFNGS